jgi:uncharacterized protein
MNTYISHNDKTTASVHDEGNASHLLSNPVTLSAEQFERLYLASMTRSQPKLAKQLGNPTPL